MTTLILEAIADEPPLNLAEIRSLEVDQLRPIEALQLLAELQRELQRELKR